MALPSERPVKRRPRLREFEAAPKPLRMLFVGNCQSASIGRLAGRLTQGRVRLDGVREQQIAELFGEGATFVGLVKRLEHIFLMPASRFERRVRGNPPANVTIVPALVYSGFFPDMVEVLADGEPLGGFAGGFHSAIAYSAFMHGLSAEQAMRLFNRRVFEHLGYFAYCDQSLEALRETFRGTPVNIDAHLPRWFRSGIFMYTLNHPTPTVMADVATDLLRHAGVTQLVEADEVAANADDEMARSRVWPVYDEIAAHLGVRPRRYLKLPEVQGAHMVELDRFISLSMRYFESIGKDRLSCERMKWSGYSTLPDFLS